MFTVVSAIIYTAVVLIALLLIGLVLVQPSKGGGFGSAFGGVGESVFGAQAMGQLSKLTVVLLTLFFVLTLTLAVMTGHRSKNLVTKGSILLGSASAPAAAPAKSASDKKEVSPAVPAKSGADRKDAPSSAPAPVKTLEKKPAAPTPAKK